MADVQELRVLIHERIRARKLPEYGQHQLYDGKGDTQPCAACELVIARWEAQYDIQLTVDPRARIDISMHKSCYDIWRNESLRLRKDHRAR